MALDPRPGAALILLLGACARLPAAGENGSDRAGAGVERGDGRPQGSVRTPHYELRASAPRDCSAAAPAARANGVRRVGVELRLTPLGDVQVPANPYYARLVDERGTVYDATLGGCGRALGPSLPARGETAHGAVVFEVPVAARDFTLSYAPALVGKATDEVEIPLGR